MEATQILMSEHRVIERVLDALEAETQRLEQGQAVRPGFFIDAADFVRGFADGCHHHKEEGVLFKAMAGAGMPMQAGPLPVMLAEHEQARVYTRGMRDAAQRWGAGDAAAQAAVIKNARAYANLLRAHIAKEDGILFPMADQVIPVERQASVLDGFEHIEHEETGEGVHEKYLALAEKLEHEAGVRVQN
jgi:hemerythrin-like domain-containing protein